jgi:hypothetical protein
MKLFEELNNRSVEKKCVIAPIEYFTNQEKEELFHILRKEADKGLTSCLITDYILAFPFLVNKQIFESILTDEGLSFEYLNNGLDCLIKWGKDYK